MQFDIKSHVTGLFRGALAAAAREAGDTPVLLERPKQPEHGDLACNVAMQLAKKLKTNPRQLAERLVAALKTQPAFAEGYVDAVEIAGAGFINLRLSAKSKQLVIARIIAQGAAFGRAPASGRKVQIEFVSANPTGPLHVGHGRGAAYGASLANLLAFCGDTVEREFYINDAGRQMDILAASVWLRYLESLGAAVAFPQDGYRADYVRAIAADLGRMHAERFVRSAAELQADPPPGEAEVDTDAALDALIARAKSLLGDDWRALHRFALEHMLLDQRNDLDEFGVAYDVWYSEQSLHDGGDVDRAMQVLGERGHLFEQDGALWFRSTSFGDAKDRVVKRENGQFTYFASDIAYHLKKYERGFERMIDVWGADHHGYIQRVKGALSALGLDADRLTIALVQFAVLYRKGERVAMGKRSGDFVTLRELRLEVGNDAARFFYVLRKSDQHLDFDLDLAKSQSNDNPVYYIQYAHARVCSVFSQVGSDAGHPSHPATDLLVSQRELTLMQRLGEFPEVVQTAARDLTPHVVAFYLRDLAADFHSYYNAERILVEDAPLAKARLALCAATRQVLASGLALLGVSAPERM
ncbi:MAG: arginine--tRNA ligase [Betaproteobacteria bacterium]|nr:arginine--tRNA ligase [Betaproteobacteria bacterium]